MKTNDKKKYVEKVLSIRGVRNIIIKSTDVPVRLIYDGSQNELKITARLFTSVVLKDEDLPIYKHEDTIIIRLNSSLLCGSELLVLVPFKSISNPYRRIQISGVNTDITISSFIFVNEISIDIANCSITSCACFKKLSVDAVDSNVTVRTVAQMDAEDIDITLESGNLAFMLDNVSNYKNFEFVVNDERLDTKILERPGPYTATGQITVIDGNFKSQ